MKRAKEINAKNFPHYVLDGMINIKILDLKNIIDENS